MEQKTQIEREAASRRREVRESKAFDPTDFTVQVSRGQVVRALRKQKRLRIPVPQTGTVRATVAVTDDSRDGEVLIHPQPLLDPECPGPDSGQSWDDWMGPDVLRQTCAVGCGLIAEIEVVA